MQKENKYTKWLESMRAKEDQEKHAFALSASLVITLLVALIWGVGFFSNVGENISSSKQSASPFNVLKDQAVQLFNNK